MVFWGNTDIRLRQFRDDDTVVIADWMPRSIKGCFKSVRGLWILFWPTNTKTTNFGREQKYWETNCWSWILNLSRFDRMNWGLFCEHIIEIHNYSLYIYMYFCFNVLTLCCIKIYFNTVYLHPTIFSFIWVLTSLSTLYRSYHNR